MKVLGLPCSSQSTTTVSRCSLSGWTTAADIVHLIFMCIIFLRESSSLTKNASRNTEKFGGRSLPVCLCESVPNAFCSPPLVQLSPSAFLTAVSLSCAPTILPSLRPFWWRSATPSSPIAEYAHSPLHTVHERFWIVADQSPPCPRTSVWTGRCMTPWPSLRTTIGSESAASSRRPSPQDAWRR